MQHAFQVTLLSDMLILKFDSIGYVVSACLSLGYGFVGLIAMCWTRQRLRQFKMQSNMINGIWLVHIHESSELVKEPFASIRLVFSLNHQMTDNY